MTPYFGNLKTAFRSKLEQKEGSKLEQKNILWSHNSVNNSRIGLVFGALPFLVTFLQIKLLL